jgi:hypothetical protein
MKNYTEVIDRSESQLISQDRVNRHRRERASKPQARLPQRAPRKSPAHSAALVDQ